jgi:hypothetical protein
MTRHDHILCLLLWLLECVNIQNRRISTCIKVKVSLCLTKHLAMKPHWGSGGIAPRNLDLGTRRGEWSASRPGRFTPSERAPSTQRIEAGWGP